MVWRWVTIAAFTLFHFLPFYFALFSSCCTWTCTLHTTYTNADNQNKRAEKWNRYSWMCAGEEQINRPQFFHCHHHTQCFRPTSLHPSLPILPFAMCFCVCSHSVLSAININQNYSITLGLFPFHLVHYTFLVRSDLVSVCVCVCCSWHLWENSTHSPMILVQSCLFPHSFVLSSEFSSYCVSFPNFFKSSTTTIFGYYFYTTYQREVPVELWLVTAFCFFVLMRRYKSGNVIVSSEQQPIRVANEFYSIRTLFERTRAFVRTPAWLLVKCICLHVWVFGWLLTFSHFFFFLCSSQTSILTFFPQEQQNKIQQKFVHLLFEGFSMAMKWNNNDHV